MCGFSFNGSSKHGDVMRAKKEFTIKRVTVEAVRGNNHVTATAETYFQALVLVNDRLHELDAQEIKPCKN